MKAMLNNAIKGDYIAAETDPSVSLYKKENYNGCFQNIFILISYGVLLEIPKGEGVPKGHIVQ